MIPEGVTEIWSATPKRAVSFTNELGRFRYLTIPKAVYPVGVLLNTNSNVPFRIASPTKALADRIAREPGFRSLVDVAAWLEGMRVDPELGCDQDELEQCAHHYGRPTVRWLLKYANKNRLAVR